MRIKKIISLMVVAVSLVSLCAVNYAKAEQGNFSLQVTPSPLVLSVEPGETTRVELKIRNSGDKVENLKIEPKSFNLSSDTGEVTLSDNAPSDVANWVSFSNQTFTIAPGEWFTEKITITMPKQAGFSYSFALIISRANDATAIKPGEAALKGSVAVFTLISIDRPDAKKQLEITNFKSTKNVYEYLPATIKSTFKNTGNTIVQPYGNIFIQRSGSSQKPISTLPVNEGRGYILPGSSRTLTSEWKDGFPSYESVEVAANTPPKRNLVWNWAHASNFRFGKYTAKLVAVYNDGYRDIPLEAETTFWIIPWKILLIVLLVLLVLAVGIITLAKKGMQFIKKTKKHHDKHGKEQ